MGFVERKGRRESWMMKGKRDQGAQVPLNSLARFFVAKDSGRDSRKKGREGAEKGNGDGGEEGGGREDRWGEEVVVDDATDLQGVERRKREVEREEERAFLMQRRLLRFLSGAPSRVFRGVHWRSRFHLEIEIPS